MPGYLGLMEVSLSITVIFSLAVSEITTVATNTIIT